MWCRPEGCATKPYKKNDDAVEAYPVVMAQEVAEVQRTVQAKNPSKPVVFKLWFMDESRFGLKTVRRRRITARGVKPVMRIQDEYENLYVFGAFAPADGSNVIWEMPFLNGNTFQHFLEAMSADPQAAEVHNIIISDNAGAHHAKELTTPANISLLFLPAYSPELNPAERVWEYMKERFAGKIFADLDALSAYITQVVDGLSNDIILSLASPDWVMDVIHAQLLT
jgi:DDE superfamily endonuclease